MPISSSDVVYRLSGGVSNTSQQASLGGAMATVAGGIITPGVQNNVWDDVSGAESAAGDAEYRCIFVVNTHGSLTLQGAVIWLDSLTSQTDLDEHIALDAAGIGVSNSNASTASENTAPSPAVSFSQPTSKGTGLLIGNIGAGQMKAIWHRRTVSPGALATAASFSIRVEGDTAP